MAKEKNIHEGHRNRLLKTIENAGITNVSNVQALEFILTYIFPRGDTNPLAHRLLDRFGSVANVLDADPLDLQAVEGVGERAAVRIALLKDIFNLYTISSIKKRQKFDSFKKIYNFIESQLRMKKEEQLLLVALDPSYHLINFRTYTNSSVVKVGLTSGEVNRFILSSRPSHIFLVHNHPGGSALASANDVASTNDILNMVKSQGINFIDHFIIGDDGIYSILSREFRRDFLDDGANDRPN